MKVVQIIQLAMLTGIDVVDYLRQIRVTEGVSGDLELTDEYRQLFERTIEDLMNRVVEMQAEAEGAPPPRETGLMFGVLKDALKDDDEVN